MIQWSALIAGTRTLRGRYQADVLLSSMDLGFGVATGGGLTMIKGILSNLAFRKIMETCASFWVEGRSRWTLLESGHPRFYIPTARSLDTEELSIDHMQYSPLPDDFPLDMTGVDIRSPHSPYGTKESKMRINVWACGKDNTATLTQSAVDFLLYKTSLYTYHRLWPEAGAISEVINTIVSSSPTPSVSVEDIYE